MTDLRKASQEAVEAARQGEQFALILAAVQAAQIVQAQQQPAPLPAPVQQQTGQAGKWIAITVGGSVLLLTVAISAVAVAIAAVSIAISSLVLYRIYKDMFGAKR
jgi:Na+/proline symporter